MSNHSAGSRDSVHVLKFGGTSLADAEQIKKAIKIIQSDPYCSHVVVSAPGKRHKEDQKITDLLYEWHREQKSPKRSAAIQQMVTDRYADIVRGLGLDLDIGAQIAQIARMIHEGESKQYAASRGEYLSGMIMASALSWAFVDPETCIRFEDQGRYMQMDDLLRQAIARRKAVIPGFYGSQMNGRSIMTFSRGGSDITGAIVARAVGATRYENWTDVDGLLMADPRVVANPKGIATLTYEELRELTYMGADVFHDEAMFPVMQAGIPTLVRNTNNPSGPSTLIVPKDTERERNGDIVGVAGRRGFTVIKIDKPLMNLEVGFVFRILRVLDDYGISFEHMPSGIDTISIIIDGKQLSQAMTDLMVREIEARCMPSMVTVTPAMAMIAVVGQAMDHSRGVAAKVFSSLAGSGVNVRMINQGSGEQSIIIGVEDADYETAVRAIYGAFVKE